MTSAELKIRIENANKKIAKKTALIAKKEATIAAGKESEYGIQWLRDDIRRLNREIAATQKTIEKYEKQLSGEIEREKRLREIPESMKAMQADLVAQWNEQDKARRQFLSERLAELGYEEFGRRFKNTGFEFTRLCDDEINRRNEQAAESLVFNLYCRVLDITGEVTNWRGIRYADGGVLNGIVIGKEGRAKVESIVAGGHNIQRLHVRVLVHMIDK